jgi:hypothetical protein
VIASRNRQVIACFRKLIRVPLLSMLLLGVFPIAPGRAQVSEDAPLSVKGSPPAELTVAWLGGAALALALANAKLTLQGQPRIYCDGLNDAISGARLWQLAEEQLTGPHERSTIMAFAIMGLQRKYPCHTDAR